MIPTTLKNAYRAAELVIRDEPIFNVPSARDNRGRIVQWAVDLGFQRLAESGNWGTAHRWRSFERPTGRYLEVDFSHSVLTISQVENPRHQPRNVRFRENKRLASQLTMKEIINDPVDNTPTPHILLIHGYQSLDFVYLGIPDRDHRRGWIYRTTNLLLGLHEATITDKTPIEQTDYDAVMTIKEDIDRQRRDGHV